MITYDRREWVNFPIYVMLWQSVNVVPATKVIVAGMTYDEQQAIEWVNGNASPFTSRWYERIDGNNIDGAGKWTVSEVQIK